ncbi:MAG TPA: alpha-mannosyltransferase [Rhodobiaceae bacterium]|nr:alpha-mannosyltransferase [Rhodobiaceae bacterium]
MKRILIVTDAWHPQVNGVVRTMQSVIDRLKARGLEIRTITPDMFLTVPLPVYPEVQLSLFGARKIRQIFDAFEPDAVHISTEGPLGWAARNLCVKRGLSFTTSYHTKFPEYVSAMLRVPTSWGYRVIRRFHAPSSAVMVATKTLENELVGHGFENVVSWTRGVDTDLFTPKRPPALELAKPVSVYVGRVSVEKNIEAFLHLDMPGTKLVVGGGPQLDQLKQKYPDVVFTGPKFGEDLAAHYTSGDIFVFPSLTDTFGLVMLEAMASGLPVAAFSVTGPLDVLEGTDGAFMDEDLSKAVDKALRATSKKARKHAEKFSWEACTDQFLANLVHAR